MKTAEEKKKDTITIIVNARKKEVEGDSVSYDQIVNLAFNNNPPTGEYIVITVTYSAGVKGAQGSLLAGDSVAMKNGMIFNVTATDKS
ncbi:MAG: multiubiquitin domain-containing protein [Rhodothermales bacterium]